ncbi:hypothetical protein FALB51S_02731 [Frigidibacter albus]
MPEHVSPHRLRRLAAPLTLAAALAVVALAPAAAQTPPVPVQESQAAAEAARLVEALQLPALMEIMQREGVAYGEDLRADLFPGQGGAEWTRSVEGIYAPDRLMPLFTQVFDAELEGADTAAMRAFFEAGPGARAVELEIAARRALLDPGVEEAADQQLEEMLAGQSPRLLAIEEFAEANELVEMNVLGGLNANLAFYRGMIDGGGLPQETSEAQSPGRCLVAGGHDPHRDTRLALFLPGARLCSDVRCRAAGLCRFLARAGRTGAEPGAVRGLRCGVRPRLLRAWPRRGALPGRAGYLTRYCARSRPATLDFAGAIMDKPASRQALMGRPGYELTTPPYEMTPRKGARCPKAAGEPRHELPQDGGRRTRMT